MGSLDMAANGAQLVVGPVGPMEVFVDLPDKNTDGGIAIITHPQPMQGGNAAHKIPLLLARALRDAGWMVVRPNFRGVGRSAGTHDYGVGETQDVLMLYQELLAANPGVRMALVGFSFGAFIQAKVARALVDQNQPPWRVCLVSMATGEVEGQRYYETPTDIPNALIIHGEKDERVSLSAVLDWARPQVQPVVVVPAADHFFTGKLHVLRSLVLAHITAKST